MGNYGLEPIVLDEFGNQLLELPAVQALTTHTKATDSLTLGTQIGIHGAECGEPIWFLPSSQTHDALICRRCLLRISVPTGLKTYAELALATKAQEKERIYRRNTLAEAHRQTALNTPDC